MGGYPELTYEIALELAGSTRWRDVRAASFELLASAVGEDVPRTSRLVEETLDALVRTRAEARALTTLPDDAWHAIDAHWKRVPLLRDRAA